MKLKTLFLMCSLTFSFCSLYANANELITVTTDSFLPETYKIPSNANSANLPGEMGGLAGEIMNGAFAKNSIKYNVVWSPWKRAQQFAINNANKTTFILPLTRNAEREAKYKWVASLYHLNIVFITRKESPKINNLAEAKGKQIGVAFGTSYEQTLRNFGIHPNAVADDEHNAKALSNNKIDAWYSDIIGAYAIIDKLKLNRSDFVYGGIVTSEENWLATGKNTSDELVNKIQSSLEEFKKGTEYKEIIKRYIPE